MNIGIPEKDALLEAKRRVQKHAHITPVLENSGINEKVEARLFFKCENFQKVGAFKFRGAINTIFQLDEKNIKQGVATHSSGNHGQAIALAARMKGIPAYIVMPKNSTKSKIEAVHSYGAEVILCDNSLKAREEELEKVLEDKGAYFVHPYNDYRVIAGQSTSAQELIDQVKDLDVIVTPIGGGGLISGTLLAVQYFSFGTKVYGVEPEGANSAYLSHRNHKLTPIPDPETVCDGLRAGIGEKNYQIIEKYIEDVYCVSDEEALKAMQLIWERMKIVIEPSCAVPLAGLLKNVEVFRNKRIGIILTGGNVDFTSLSEFFN